MTNPVSLGTLKLNVLKNDQLLIFLLNEIKGKLIFLYYFSIFILEKNIYI